MEEKQLKQPIYYQFSLVSDSKFQEKNLGRPVKQVTQEEFLKHIFNDFKGNLCIFQKTSGGTTKNVFYNHKNMDRMYSFLDKTFGIDTYVSYSTYFRNKKKNKDDKLRTQSNIVQTYMLVQDLDYYKIGMTDSEFLKELGKMIESGEIICPNFIVSTGQGYQLIWLIEPFKNIAGYTNDRDWTSLQEHLFQALKKFNSDSVVKSPSAVTRIPGTKHRKTGNIVYGYLANEAYLTLKDMLFYYGITPISDRKVTPNKTVQKSKNVTRMVGLWNEFTLNRQREEDIFIYVSVLNERKESYIGKRNWLSLVLRFHALVSSDGDKKYAAGRVLDLCGVMDMSDTTEKEILRRSQPSERYYEEWVNGTWDKNKYIQGGLFYTNARMLELMEAKDDYYLQWKMKTIKIKTKKYDTMRKHFEARQKGKIKCDMNEYNENRSDKAFERKQKAIELKEKGYKYKEIAEELGIKVDTVKGYFRKGK